MTTRHALRLFFPVLAVLAAACGPSSGRPDASSGSDSTIPVDASPFGAACTTDTECPGGYCVPGFGDKVCTAECTAGCPQSWQCHSTPVGGEQKSICVPPVFQLCTSCTANTQCGDGVCVTLGGEGFCLPHCPFEGSCPQGYTCGADPTGMNTGDFCVPMTSTCTCTAGGDEGQLRTCSKANAIGTCQGLETCHPAQGGWGGCTAASATTETCDGLDNDCNGLVDDGVASGQPCAITNANGSCAGVTLCTGAGGTICQGKTPAQESCNSVDDDCDMMADEGFPGLNNVCSAGVGGCQRFGVIRCDAGGLGTQCTAVAGSPQTELCNAVDDNCNGQIDETFTTLGQACSVGVGACTRQGNLACAANGMGTQCSVAPGISGVEACNTIDDDCDNKIDEDFKDASGNFTRDRACGSCAVDCTVIFGLPNAFGTCVAGPQCQMNCNPGAFNLDGAIANGCEFALDPLGAIYVSIDDPAAADDATCGLGPVGTGAGNHPCRTIAKGLARAAAANLPKVFVANGVYNEAVTLVNGRSVLGGYRPDNWIRDLSATGTVLLGSQTVDAIHLATVVASGITMPTVFEGFAVYGAVNPTARGNSYAIYAAGATANLVLRSNTIFAGRGGPGTGGAIGSDGTNGGNGQGRNPNVTNDPAYDSKNAVGAGACASTNDRHYTNHGASLCNGNDDVSGGDGGGNSCPGNAAATCSGCGCVAGGATCSSCSFQNGTPNSGTQGSDGTMPGGGFGGGGGALGNDMIQRTISPCSGFAYTLCFFPPSDTEGGDGADGNLGGDGTGVTGCSAIAGSVVAGHWTGAIAATGRDGFNGGGGGGGGAGAGSHCNNCSSGKDTLGAHGGGGGGGGCGGRAGSGASAGGGAFGIFITGTGAPVVTTNTVFRGEGGVGGGGGAGGKGGLGGSGGLGGTQGNPATFCTDGGGRGGRGGDGGNASGGGGGCGGSSYGIYTSGVGTPNYCMAAAANTFTGGQGGTGGPGGSSLVSPGGTGSAGALMDCAFN